MIKYSYTQFICKFDLFFERDLFCELSIFPKMTSKPTHELAAFIGQKFNPSEFLGKILWYLGICSRLTCQKKELID